MRISREAGSQHSSPYTFGEATSSNDFMQETISPSRRRRWLIAFLFVGPLLAAAAKKFFDYSAPPDKEKESDFVYPPNAEQTKPTTLVAEAEQSSALPFEQRGG